MRTATVCHVSIVRHCANAPSKGVRTSAVPYMFLLAGKQAIFFLHIMLWWLLASQLLWLAVGELLGAMVISRHGTRAPNAPVEEWCPNLRANLAVYRGVGVAPGGLTGKGMQVCTLHCNLRAHCVCAARPCACALHCTAGPHT